MAFLCVKEEQRHAPKDCLAGKDDFLNLFIYFALHMSGFGKSSNAALAL